LHAKAGENNDDMGIRASPNSAIPHTDLPGPQKQCVHRIVVLHAVLCFLHTGTAITVLAMGAGCGKRFLLDQKWHR